ncbi:MAG: hypothetical protein U0T07_00145 [Chitinophagales bacterium]
MFLAKRNKNTVAGGHKAPKEKDGHNSVEGRLLLHVLLIFRIDVNNSETKTHDMFRNTYYKG